MIVYILLSLLFVIVFLLAIEMGRVQHALKSKAPYDAFDIKYMCDDVVIGQVKMLEGRLATSFSALEDELKDKLKVNKE